MLYFIDRENCLEERFINPFEHLHYRCMDLKQRWLVYAKRRYNALLLPLKNPFQVDALLELVSFAGLIWSECLFVISFPIPRVCKFLQYVFIKSSHPERVVENENVVSFFCCRIWWYCLDSIKVFFFMFSNVVKADNSKKQKIFFFI